MEALASLVGVSWQTVQQWENGKTAPRRTRLARVAEALGTTVEYLSLGNDLKPNQVEGSREAYIGGEAPAWPFRRVTRGVLNSLKADDLARVEGAIIAVLDSIRRGERSGSHSDQDEFDDNPFPYRFPAEEPGPADIARPDRPSTPAPFSADTSGSWEGDPFAANDELIDVREYDVRMAAGSSIENHDSPPIGQVPISRNQLRQRGIDPDKVYVVRARGDSMSPTIPDGALMLFVAEPPNSWHDIRSERIYGIRQNGGLAVKRIARSKLTGSWVAKSDNHKAFPDFHLQDDEQVKVLGWVAWVCGPSQSGEGRWI